MGRTKDTFTIAANIFCYFQYKLHACWYLFAVYFYNFFLYVGCCCCIAGFIFSKVWILRAFVACVCARTALLSKWAVKQEPDRKNNNIEKRIENASYSMCLVFFAFGCWLRIFADFAMSYFMLANFFRRRSSHFAYLPFLCDLILCFSLIDSNRTTVFCCCCFSLSFILPSFYYYLLMLLLATTTTVENKNKI